MNKCILIFSFSSLIPLTFFCMEDSDQPTRLQKKYSSPVNWELFASENLDEYSQDEIAPFLFSAIAQKAPINLIKRMLDENELSPNSRDAQGYTALTIAVLNRNLEATVVLLNRKAKVVYEMDRLTYSKSYDEHQNVLTPWQAACVVGQEKYLRLVHGKMSPQDQRQVIRQPMHNLDKKSPIDHALIHRKSELAQFLCSVDPYLVTDNYDSQRGVNAAGWHDATYLKILFERIPLFIESDKSRLLAVAVNANNQEGTQFLLSQGAQANALMCVTAALHENKAILDQLCKAGVSLKIKDNPCHQLPLKECLHSPQLKSVVPVRMLIEAGADEHHRTIHHINSNYFDLPLKKALVDLYRAHGVQLDTPDQEGQTLLHHACSNYFYGPDDTFMFYLLDLGANPDIANKNGETPFLLFCHSNRNSEKLRLFIETYSPNLNIEDARGNTPLVHAACQGKKSHALIALLLNYHADIKKSRDKMLHQACATLNVELAQTLIETHGANAKQADNQGKTTLMNALTATNFLRKKESTSQIKIEDARKRLMSLLLKYGVSINAQDNEGQTALHHAVAKHLPKPVLATLLNEGALATIRDNNNQTPLEISLRNLSCHQDNKKTELLLAHTHQNPLILSMGETPVEYLLNAEGIDNRRKITLLELFVNHNPTKKPN